MVVETNSRHNKRRYNNYDFHFYVDNLNFDKRKNPFEMKTFSERRRNLIPLSRWMNFFYVSSYSYEKLNWKNALIKEKKNCIVANS